MARAARRMPSRRASRPRARPNRWSSPARCGRNIPAPTCSRTCPRTAPKSNGRRRSFPTAAAISTSTITTGSWVRAPSTAMASGSTDAELARMHESGTAIAHCPTSNHVPGQRTVRSAQGEAVRTARARGPRDRRRRRHHAVDAARPWVPPTRWRNSAAAVCRRRSAFYLATRGGAQALYLEDRIGSIAVGMEADLVVLDLKSTPLIDFRMRHCDSLDEALFVQMTMADERAVRAVYVNGVCASSSACRETRLPASRRRRCAAAGADPRVWRDAHRSPP